jgi:hypothetical protein
MPVRLFSRVRGIVPFNLDTVSDLNLYVTRNLSKSELTPPPPKSTYKTPQVIYVFTMSVYILKICRLSVFYMKQYRLITVIIKKYKYKCIIRTFTEV